MKAAVLVNGVPASGKSSVARALAEATGFPLLTLDTIKEALFAHLGTGDRNYNRMLGRASYEAIFALAGDFADGATVIVDAWFGFQPPEVLRAHLKRGGLSRVVEIWCHAPADVIGSRYGARLGTRSSGHLGAEYVPELIELAKHARPLGTFPLHEIDTTKPFATSETVAWLTAQLSDE